MTEWKTSLFEWLERIILGKEEAQLAKRHREIRKDIALYFKLKRERLARTNVGEKKPETASQMLESLIESLLGEEPDFKSMPAEEVAAYLQKENLDAERVFRVACSALVDANRLAREAEDQE